MIIIPETTSTSELLVAINLQKNLLLIGASTLLLSPRPRCSLSLYQLVSACPQQTASGLPAPSPWPCPPSTYVFCSARSRSFA